MRLSPLRSTDLCVRVPPKTAERCVVLSSSLCSHGSPRAPVWPAYDAEIPAYLLHRCQAYAQRLCSLILRPVEIALDAVPRKTDWPSSSAPGRFALTLRFPHYVAAAGLHADRPLCQSITGHEVHGRERLPSGRSGVQVLVCTDSIVGDLQFCSPTILPSKIEVGEGVKPSAEKDVLLSASSRGMHAPGRCSAHRYTCIH